MKRILCRKVLSYLHISSDGDTPLDWCWKIGKRCIQSHLISTYNPNNNQIRDIVLQNWDILCRSSATKDLAEKKVVFEFRKNPNLKVLLVRGKSPKSRIPVKSHQKAMWHGGGAGMNVAEVAVTIAP